MASLERGNKNKDVIKNNEIIGYANTLKVLDVDIEENEPLDNNWTEDRIKKEILLYDKLRLEQKDKIYEMFNRVKGALSKNDNDIGTANISPHKIDVIDGTPIWQRARNFSEPVSNEIEKQCQDLLSNDILQYSNSQWSSPVVPVRKSDCTLRICIDYRKVNKITKQENFPMPNISNCIYKAHNIKYFTKLDLVRGFYQVRLDRNSRKYTAFSTVNNHYEFKRLSFGLRNSGIAFQKAMQQILSPLACSNIIIYIDDILILSETFDEHLHLVEKVLKTLMRAGIKVKVKKCEFFREEIDFLGHKLGRTGIRKSEEFVNKVKEIQRPVTVSQLRKFLGLVNFQIKFVRNFSLISKPLTEITGGNKRKIIEWTDQRVEAFNKLKKEIENDIILSYPDYSQNAEKMELYFDASGKGAGACLLQKQNGEYKNIGYASMCFSQTQIKYSTTERE